MKFVNFKDLYEMVVNYFEGLEDDEIMLAFMHHNERDPMLKRFDRYLTVGTHEKAEKRYRFCRYRGPRKFKEDSVVFHGDGCLWDSVKRPNAERVRHDGLAAMCTTIDDIIAIPHMVTADEIATIKKEGCCHQAPLDFYGEVRPNEESTHSEKEVEEKPLKDEKESKTNDEKFSSLEKFGLAINWASAMTMINARDFLLSVSNALSDINEKLKQEVKLEPVEEPKKDILKVKCVRAYTGCTLFIEGKVYERVNGVLVAEDAFPFEYLCKGNDPNKWMFPDHRFELYEEPVEEPKKDILKVRCTKGCTYYLCSNSMFTTGKVYERVNGVLVDDAGLEWVETCKSDNPAEWEYPEAKFELYEEPKQEPVEKPKKDILKVKCTYATGSEFIEGKVYERVNGVLMSEHGFDYWALCKDNDPSKWSFIGLFSGKPFYKFELYEEPKEEPKKDILKVKCVSDHKDCSLFFKGRVYERVDGVLKGENGWEFTTSCKSNDPKEWTFVGYDFELYEEPKEEPKKDILRVRCVEGHLIFTEGKVYERVDGVMKDDVGNKWCFCCCGDDPTKWNIWFNRFELAE